MSISIQSEIAALEQQIKKLEIQINVKNLLKTIIQEEMFVVDDIQPQSRLLSDLKLDSMEIIHLIFILEEHFPPLRFDLAQLFMKDGEYVQDITLEQIVNLILLNLSEFKT